MQVRAASGHQGLCSCVPDAQLIVAEQGRGEVVGLTFMSVLPFEEEVKCLVKKYQEVAGCGQWQCHILVGIREKVSGAWGQFEVTIAFTLYSLMQAALLCVNTTSVLHEECFLKNIG
ncbi:796 [Rattus norvegicus]|uniref:796 n=1 Tax=Rattus norvegicus TaxID=10116 RepID=A0A9K3Y6W1_RAT|nr:796 [Rattus norvegicus]EDL91439.1 796 [Rattus norvegicus]|eukprot:NP_001041421.1 uncharacterized protein LOC500270 [Rattus norvegicus]